MALSRDRQLSAVTDSFGRVTLIDNHRGVAVNMWKGGYSTYPEHRGPDALLC